MLPPQLDLFDLSRQTPRQGTNEKRPQRSFIRVPRQPDRPLEQSVRQQRAQIEQQGEMVDSPFEDNILDLIEWIMCHDLKP